MTESQSPLDAALDLLVYAPVGLALTAAEEIPKLAAKGRTQLQGQLTMARVVGQFAVAQGRKELKKRLSPAPDASRAAQSASGEGSGPADEAPVEGPIESPVARGEVSYDDMLAAPGSAVASVPRTAVTGARPAEPSRDLGAADSDAPTEPLWPEADSGAGASGYRSPSAGADVDGVHPVARHLAIPGYDSLAASQVVQRLAGLSRDELDAVGAYEAAHRSRRTILTRIRQLQGS